MCPTGRIIIFPAVLYMCETWSLTPREEHGLRLFEDRVFWRIFGSKSNEVTGVWRSLMICTSHPLLCG
jgi:hypothetical protein